MGFGDGKGFYEGGLDFGGGVGLYTPNAVEGWMGKGNSSTPINPVNFDWKGYEQGQGQQQAMNAMLLARAQGGGGPSVAENQLAQATQANRTAAASQAASARGGAMQQQAAQRNAQAQGVAVQQQAAGQGATMRAQEQQAAMGQYQGALQAQQNAELNRQLGMGQIQVSQSNAETARQTQTSAEEAKTKQGMLGMGSSVIFSGMGGGSDERMKHNVSGADKQIEDFLSHLASKKYEYNQGMGDGPGARIGIMAQDLEKSPAGKTLVVEGEDGMKYVDTQVRMPMMLLAAMADIHKRMRGAGL
jgi:hypothetical protein